MTKIVGHRGAKGLELENTIKGFKLAKTIGVDAIELDVIATKDGKFVVCHDETTEHISEQTVAISQLTYQELAEVRLYNGEFIPLLYDVLSLLKDVPIILDIKTSSFLPELFQMLDYFPDADITLTTDSLYMNRIVEAKQLRPHLPIWAPRHFLPTALIRTTKKYGAQGLNLRYIWLNPITYLIAQKKGLEIHVYTVNSVVVAKIIKRFYPRVWICTNRPDLLQQTL